VKTAEDVAYKSGPISQMGRIYVLPLKSAIFSTKSISATFSEAGVPTLLGVTGAASSDKVCAMLTSLGNSAASMYKTKSEMQANEIDAKIKMLTLQKQYQDAINALNPAVTNSDGKSVGDFSASTALANAEVADIAAKKALDDAKKVVN
jgi:Tfp pilus assembly protein PilN